MQIDVDFDVFKSLTVLRKNEKDTLNDVLRRLTNHEPAARSEFSVKQNGASGCVFKGILFPEGTDFRAAYKGKLYFGSIVGGEWKDPAGNAYSSPSQAAFAIQGSGVNGWTFWECKRPSDTEWIQLAKLRKWVPVG
jgi:hypothetical protein